MEWEDEKNDEELAAIIMALQRWFKGQGIKPLDAKTICLLYATGLLVQNSSCWPELNENISDAQERIARCATGGFYKMRDQQ